jgi:hypothetical protein
MDANLPAAHAACNKAPRMHSAACAPLILQRAGRPSGPVVEIMHMVRFCRLCRLRRPRRAREDRHFQTNSEEQTREHKVATAKAPKHTEAIGGLVVADLARGPSDWGGGGRGRAPERGAAAGRRGGRVVGQVHEPVEQVRLAHVGRQRAQLAVRGQAARARALSGRAGDRVAANSAILGFSPWRLHSAWHRMPWQQQIRRSAASLVRG